MLDYSDKYKSFSGDELYLCLGKIEYLRKKYKGKQIKSIVESIDFCFQSEYLIIKECSLPIKINLERIQIDGFDYCFKLIKKVLIRSIENKEKIVSYRIELN